MDSSSVNKSQEPEYPIYTVRFLSVHALGVPSVWFLGAIASMQFIGRSNSTLPFNDLFAGFNTTTCLAIVLAPIIFSVVWTAINFGQPTIQEIKRVLADVQGN